MPELIIVTGAGSGIGAAVAAKFASLGHPVALADIDGDAAKQMAKRLGSQGFAAASDQVDVTDCAAMEHFVTEQVDRFGRPEAAIACAGIAGTGLVTEMAPDQFDRIMAVNVKGVYSLARAVMPYLSRNGGSFTAIASDAAINGFQGYAAYCASKHAVAGMIKVLALDHGPSGVRCNAICPGYVETPMLDRLLKELPGNRSDYEEAVPLGRFATPEDVANLAIFLAGDASRYLNGAIIPLDGGGSAGPFQPTPRLQNI